VQSSTLAERADVDIGDDGPLAEDKRVVIDESKLAFTSRWARPRQFAGPALSPADVESLPYPRRQTPTSFGDPPSGGPAIPSKLVQVARPHSTKNHRSAEWLMSENRKIEKLFGCRPRLERRISLLAVHPTP
jgi:hypothetical protein